MFSFFTGLTVHFLPEMLVNHTYFEVIVVIFLQWLACIQILQRYRLQQQENQVSVDPRIAGILTLCVVEI